MEVVSDGRCSAAAVARTLRRLLPGVFAVVLCAAAFAAGDAEPGRRAFDRQDYAKAISLWTPLAEKGDAEAQFGLGVMHEKGLGVPQDYAEAARLYRRAAQQGYAPAQFNLGAAYEAGRGVPRDLSRAATWWRKAAEQSFGRAAYNLATLYYYGWGVPQNYEEAANWYERAADAGDASAARVLEGLKKKIALVPGKSEQPSAAPGAPATELKGEAWLLDQPADSYTLQLFANWTEASVRRFAAEAGLGSDAAFFAARYREYPWFVLVHGVYPSESAAMHALETLPMDVKLMGPWVRPMAEVQQLIRQRVVDAAPRDVVIDPLRSPSGETRELLAVETPPPARAAATHKPEVKEVDKQAAQTDRAPPAAQPSAERRTPPAPSTGERVPTAVASAQPAPERPAVPEPKEAPPRKQTGEGAGSQAAAASTPGQTAQAAPAPRKERSDVVQTPPAPPEEQLASAATPPAPSALSPAADPLGWIRSQPRGRYTIQVVAVTRLSSAREFIVEHGLQDEAAYFAARHEGRLWFDVVLGAFDSLSAARSRLAALPEPWQKWAPWIRDFGGIHDIMLDALPQAEDAAAGPAPSPVARTPAVPSPAAPAARAASAASPVPDDPRQRLYLGQKAFNAGRYREAERLWRPLAEAGMSGAQYNLAFLYESGWGVAPDYAQAAQWYRRAARQGHAQAQNNLGRMYLEGLGVDRDVASGLHWLRAAAEAGNADAARELAEAYAQGRYGLPQDSGLARYWSERTGGRG